MPLQTRRPELARISVPAPTFFDHGDPVTPLPCTPMPYEQCHPMILTPTMSLLELDPEVLDTPMAGSKRARPLASPASVLDDSEGPKLEWDSREDGIVQSFLSHPLHPLSSPFPPSTIPPPGALDELASQIMHYHRAPSSLSNSTSLPQLSAVASSQEQEPTASSTSQPKTRPRAATAAGWKHSWAATRQRLFELARKESREAIGGVSKRARGQKPEISRNNSMAFLETGDEEQPGIGEVLRLSTSLQRSSNAQGSSGGLAGQSLNGLSSPLSFSPVPSRRNSQASAGLSSSTQPRSLLSRGRSFTADDFDSYISNRCSSPPAASQSDAETDVEDDSTPKATRIVSKPHFNMSFTPIYRDAQDDVDVDVDMDVEVEPTQVQVPPVTLTLQAPSPRPAPAQAPRTRRPVIDRDSRSPSPTPAFGSLTLGSASPIRTGAGSGPDKKRQRLLNVSVPLATSIGWTDAGLRSPFEEGPARRLAF